MRIRAKELRTIRKRTEERHKTHAAKPAAAATTAAAPKRESKPKAKPAAKETSAKDA